MVAEIDRIKSLITILNRYTVLYDKGTPAISDQEWDKLYFELKELEEKTNIVYPNSPTQKVHFETVSELKKIKHTHSMLSLDKTKEVKDIENFVNKSSYKDTKGWCAMFKMDGLTCSLVYINGKLDHAETRGNGEVGEDITHNALVINTIPKTIPTDEEVVVIDGEIICDYLSFKDFKDEYKNPRNFAAGSIRQLSSKEAASRNLSFIAWDLIQGCEDIDFFFWRLEKLDEWGFITVPRIGDAETVKDAIEMLDSFDEHEYYPIDGYVFRFQSQKYYNSLGSTDHHFRGAMAYKFYDEEYDTKLKYIDWTMGRTGVLTPVAVFEPVDIDGTEVERASLHNYGIMRELFGDCAYVGQPIKVFKANMIIPQVSSAEEKHDYGYIVSHGGTTANDEPEHCPYCGGLPEKKTSVDGVINLYCSNPNCEGKLVNKINHFCGKKGLDIKGISKATIEKLINWGWLNGSISELYDLQSHRADWISKSGFGTASVDKILNAIEQSKSNASLEGFISGIGIPLVGKTIAKEICKYFTTWQDFRAAVGDDWTVFEGFGSEISKAINTFDYTEADKIAAMLTFSQPEAQSEEKKATLEGKVFVITGKVHLYKNRDELKAEIESLGGKVASAVSSKTDYLINNDNTSTTAKNKKAQELNIPIITEEDYQKLSRS